MKSVQAVQLESSGLLQLFLWALGLSAVFFVGKYYILPICRAIRVTFLYVKDVFHGFRGDCSAHNCRFHIKYTKKDSNLIELTASDQFGHAFIVLIAVNDHGLPITGRVLNVSTRQTSTITVGEDSRELKFASACIRGDSLCTETDLSEAYKRAALQLYNGLSN